MASHDDTAYIDDWETFGERGYSDLSYATRANPKPWGRYQTEVLAPGNLSFSDYSGSTIERSNVRVWANEFEDLEGTAWKMLYGGHGTEAVVIRVDAMTAEMRDFLAALEQYPVADESDMSRLEAELQDEAWESWAKREFKGLALKATTAVATEEFPDANEDLVEDAVDEAFDKISDDELYQMFHDAADAANEYWETETGGGQVIRMGHVVDRGLDADTVLEFLLDKGYLDENILMSEDAAQLWRARRNPDQLPLKFDGLHGGRR